MSKQKDKENTSQESSLKKIIQSNKLILDLLNKQTSLDLKKNLLNSTLFIEKMSSLFNHYLKKEKAPIPQAANDKEEKEHLKDLEELKQKITNEKLIKLTSCIEYILIYFADNLNLTFEISYEIIENYFNARPEELAKLYNMEEVYKSMMNSGDNLNDPKYESVYKRYHQIQVDTINNLTKEFYLERILLLRIYTVLVKSLNDNYLQIKEESRIFFKKIFKAENSFVKKFSDLFCSYNVDTKLAKNFDYQDQIEDHSLAIIREQSIILENILIFSLNFQINHTDSFRKLFNYLIETNYTGYLNTKISDVCSLETRNLFVFYAERIIDFSFLLIIKNMLLGALSADKNNLLPINFQSKIISYEENYSEKKENFLFFTKENIDFFYEKILNVEKIANNNNNSEENCQINRSSYINKILILIFFYLTETIDKISKSEKEDLITQKAKNILALLTQKKINSENLSLSNFFFEEYNFQITITHLNSLIEKEFLNEDSQNYNLNYPYLIISLSNLIINVKYLTENNLLFPSDNNELKKIIDLLEKIYNNKNILENYWDSLYKERNDTLMNLLNKLISQFPINIDLLLKLYFCLLKFKQLGEKSNFILTNLLHMKYYTCYVNDCVNKFEISDAEENFTGRNRNINSNNTKTITLLEENNSEILKIPRGTKGIILNTEGQQLDNKINDNELDNEFNNEITKPILVTFFIEYSFYDFIFQKWEMVNDHLINLKKYGNTNDEKNPSNDIYEKICVDYVRLFCEFISNSNKNIEKYIDSTIKEILVKEDIKKIYVQLINLSFLTLHLIGNDGNCYSNLHYLVNAIYRMIISLISNRESSFEFMRIFIAKFILFSSEYEGISLNNPTKSNNYQAEKFNQYNNYNYNTTEKNRFSNSNYNSNLNVSSNSNNYQYQKSFHNNNNNPLIFPGCINIPELFSNTIKLDKNIKNYENTLIILELIKLFYQSPIIFNLINTENALEFLDSLWRNIIAEGAKSFYNFNTINDDQLPLLNEILEIINELLNLLTFSAKKTKIISTFSFNNLEKILISSLNQIDIVKLILPILNTNIKIQKTFNTKNLIFENILDNIVTSEKLNFHEFRFYKRELIKNSMRMLSFIFDKLITWEKTKIFEQKNSQKISNEENDLLKIYENLELLKIWHQIFFESKNFVANKIRYENNDYTINLIISLFAYLDFDLVNKYAFSYCEYFCFVSSSNPKNLEKYLLQNKNFDDKFCNIGELAIENLNKILYLFNLNKEINKKNDSNVNANANLNLNLNLMDYLFIKKETSINDVNNFNINMNLHLQNDGFINVMESIKYKIFAIMECKSYTLKNRLLQFLVMSSNFQINFFSHLMEETKNSIDEIKFWDIIFNFIDKEKSKILNYQMEKDKKQDSNFMLNYCRREICLISILFDNIFKHENFYKISIKNLLENYCDKEFPKFLEFSAELNNADLQNEKIEINLDTEISNFEEFSNNIINEAIAIKSLCNVFSKLILISESKFYNLKFDKLRNLYKKFFEKNVGNFIKGFISVSNSNNSNANVSGTNANFNIDNKFINDFNILLQSQNSKCNYEENVIFNNNDIYINTSPANNNNIQNIINIKTYFKTFDLTEDNYFLGLLDSLGPLSYNIFHWLDLKELYILMKIKNYKMEIFFEFFDQLMQYNLQLSQACAQVNTNISIAHFINLIFSSCKNENINSTYLFNGKSSVNLANSTEKNLANEIMQKEKSNYKKINFEIFKLYNNDIEEFFYFLTVNFINFFSEDNKNPQNPQNFTNFFFQGNFFSQFFSYKYNSLFFVLEYLKNFYQLKISEKQNLNEKKFVENLQMYYNDIHKILLNKQLVKFVQELNFYVKSEKTSEIEKSIFSLINLIYGIFSFLVNTNFEVESNSQLEILNFCVKNLFAIFNSNCLCSYDNNITLISCAYMNLTNLSRDFFKGNKVVENLIPILESNNNGKKEYYIVKLIMRKLKPEISSSNFLIILKFLISLIKSYDLFAIDIIINEKILMNFIINNPLGNSIDIPEYEENERGIRHLLYCSIWDFLKNLLISISDFEGENYDSIYFSVMEYLKLHEERIFKILRNSEFKDNVGNYYKKSLGYLEELENVTNVLNLLFHKSEKWKNHFPDFYLKVLLLILEDTFRLFSPNVKISNHYVCHSNYEYRMNEIKYSNEKDILLQNNRGNNITDEAASIFSPLKIIKNPENLRNFNKPKDTLNYFGFIPTIFYYRIDCCLITILYNLTNIIKKTLVKENQNNQFVFVNYILENSKPSKVKNIEEHINNLVYLYFYAIHCYDTNIKNFEMMKNLYNKSCVFFNNTISSYNLGGYNLDDYKDYYFFTMFALQNILNINVSYNNILYSSRSNYGYSFPKQLKEVTIKKLDFIKILQKKIEDDNKIPELKAYARANENLFNFIKTSFEIK